MWLLVSTSRRIGNPSASTSLANGSYCDGTASASISVMPSSSTTTPALARPSRLGSCSQQ
jgi:hypothetical protein